MIKKVTVVTCLFMVLCSSVLNAQYTLKDTDVVVTNGIIESCSYNFAIKDIIIPPVLDGQAVTGIKDASYSSYGVFYNKRLTSVVLPDGLTHIGDYAFYYNSIVSISIPNTVEYIGTWTLFMNSISSIDLPANLTHIGEAAFNGNQVTTINGENSDGIIYKRNPDASVDSTTIACYGGNNQNVSIPSQVTTIAPKAFYECSINGVDFSKCKELAIIAKGAFESNNLTSLDLSNCASLTIIDDLSFYFNEIENINLNSCSSLTYIGSHAFMFCSIVNLDLGNCSALNFIGESAFRENKLTEVNLPNSITHLGEIAFNDNQITIVNNAPSDGIFYKYNADTTTDSTTIISFGGATKDIAIPSQVVTIGSRAFRNSQLKSVDFSACTGLKYINTAAFEGNEIVSMNLGTCSNLVSIEDYAFTYNYITSLDLGECSSLSSIGDYAFRSCSLANIDLSACTNLTYIGSRAFSNNNLTGFTLPTPDIPGYQFNYWHDGTNQHAGGDTVSNFDEDYWAKFVDCYSVSFYVYDQERVYIPYATVKFGDFEEQKTDEYGRINFPLVHAAYNIPFSISANNFETHTSTLSLTDYDKSVTIYMRPTYSASFKITDGTNVITNATVNLTGYGSVKTDTSGIAVFDSVSVENNISYTVTADRYFLESGSISVVDTNVMENVSLNPLPTYDVNFTITDGTDLIAHATVELDGYGSVTTNTSGIAVFNDVSTANNIVYSVKSDKYYTANGTVSVVDSEVNESVVLTLRPTYTVSFVVAAGTNTIAGASVTLDGYGSATTDESGIAVFNDVSTSDAIAYTVSADGYETASGSISVVDGDVRTEVSLSASAGFYDLQNEKLSVYPNPVVEILTISQPADNSIERVELYSITGQKVIELPVTDKNEAIRLDVQALNTGTYIVKCYTSNKQVLSSKIVKN